MSDGKRASFANMAASTAEDWLIIGSHMAPFARALPDRVLAHLQLLDGDFGGFPVDRLTHCLQTATLAHRDGRDDEYVVCALLHDIGDTLGSYNHADIGAAILKPFVSDENVWMVGPPFDRTEEFCRKYDSAAFDPEGEALPLSFFEPKLRALVAQPKHSIYRAALAGK
ncbi:MAG: HD domain-containing protein [Myxococcales bacterium]|nr:HD domain-containing protein [Myxococcales bacterium]